MASKCGRPPCRSTMPEYKKAYHIGHSYAPCPFSTQADSKRVRILLRDMVYDGVNAVTDLLAVFTERSNPNYGQYVIGDGSIDALLLNRLGYIRNDHSTLTGNREDTNVFGAEEYLKYPTFGGTVYMATQARISAWGFECAFNDCSYRQNNNGMRYFYT